MASSLAALLAQQTPVVPTRKGLLILGLQNDLVSADGKLPVNVPAGFWCKLAAFVPAFREFGDVIWVRSESDARGKRTDIDRDNVITASHVEAGNGRCRSDMTSMTSDKLNSPVPTKRPRKSWGELCSTLPAGTADTAVSPDDPLNADADDHEYFLSSVTNRGPCCVSGTPGAEFCPEVGEIMDKRRDIVFTTSDYSAFKDGSLLQNLRVNLITELFVCGGPTNSSIHATAMDAASNGIHINLIEDCLLARRKETHDLTIKRLQDFVMADLMMSVDAIEFLRNPPPPRASDEEDEGNYDESDDELEEDTEGISDERTLEQLLAADSDEDNDDSEEAAPNVRELTSQLRQNLQDLRFASPTLSHASVAMSAPQQAMSSRPAESSLQPQKYASPYRENKIHSDRRLTSNSTDPVREHIRSLRSQAGSSKIPGLNVGASSMALPKTSIDQFESAMAGNRQVSWPLFGEGREAESGGSTIWYNLLSPEVADTVFDSLYAEIQWQSMHHQSGEVPRLVCCQGTIGEDGSTPIYRHPSDRSLAVETWTPTVDMIRKAAEERTGHPLNHALIQLYRGGTDYISEHSDKTLDITKDTYIVNVSFGAQRTMRFRTKRTGTARAEDGLLARTTHRVPMPHNSMIQLSLGTNAEYLHGINADKRPRVELDESEMAFGGRRISLTFRHIGTFLDHDSSRIWGQGATAKTKEEALAVINGDPAESEKLVRAFGVENQATSIQWEATYGKGSDVLHLK